MVVNESREIRTSRAPDGEVVKYLSRVDVVPGL